MFRGIVVHGDKIGRTFGYPTANLDILSKDTKCKSGVYAAEVTFRREKYKAVLVVNEMKEKIEVYLFGYQGGEFYGEELTVEAIQKVSELERYENMDELKEKIANDILLVKKVLKI
jgi:riboflavin kinase/FMN adenylyltransferase